MTSPSMVQRAGDTLVIRSLVSGDQLFVSDSGTEAEYSDEVIVGEEDKKLPQCKIRRNYSCSNCNYFTQNPRHFLYHLRDVHQEKVKIYECPNCLYASKHFQKLLRHMKMVHGSYDNLELAEATKGKSHKKKKQSVTEHVRKADLESKLEYEPPDKKSKLDVKNCDDTMGKSSAELKCSLCSFTTRHQGQLTRHEKQEHIKTKFFRCSKCSYVTHIKARFTKHVKYHSMPMIKCDLCDFRTPYKWNLDRHYKNHNGHGSFRCSACNFTADIKQSLTVHEMNHHVPPVGQAAGLGVGRRRNKVGASDTTAAEDEEHDHELRLERERHRQNGLQEDFLQTSTPKHHENGNKINSKLKSSLKKQKNNLQQNDKHNFYMDFIHSDDIIHHSNGNIYIKKKCKYCNFKTAWDTEMLKHEKKNHNFGDDIFNNFIPKKVARPIPNLIPIQCSSLNFDSFNGNQKFEEIEEKSSDVINLADIKELSAKAGFSSLQDFISLLGDDETDMKNSSDNIDNSKTDLSILNSSSSGNNSLLAQPSLDCSNADLKRKHTSFFDKLKAKLMTNAGESCNLTCKYCGHESKCLSELAGHQKICGKKSNNSNIPSKVFNTSSTRCQFCRQRCKSSIDLRNHLQICPNINQKDCSTEDKSETSETTKEELDEHQEPHPMENVVFVWNNIAQPAENEVKSYEQNHGTTELSNFVATPVRIPTPESEISIESTPVTHTTSKMPTHGNDLDQVSEGKRVFKCPHCSFWASTASRFHVHIVGHLNKKPFECSLCAYRSNWRWDITKHIRLKSVRDSAHAKAKVLMTDETGRRNYSKYNKYLTQMKSSKSQTDEKHKNEKIASIDQVASPNFLPILPKLIKGESGQNKASNVLRPPPPLKPAYVTYFTDMSEQNKKRPDVDMNKKTLFKCKKCNFRDANRENILLHVKGHYRHEENAEYQIENSDNNLDDERHCRLKHNGDVRVVVGGKSVFSEKQEVFESSENESDNLKQEEFYKCSHCQYSTKIIDEIEGHIDKHLNKENDLKCCFCLFSTPHKYELYDHLKSHDISDPEDYINKSISESSFLSENSLMYSKRFQCLVCPFVSAIKQQFLTHKQFHRSRGAPYKCHFCGYNVPKGYLLQQHLKLHEANNTNDIKPDTNFSTDFQIENYTFKEIPFLWIFKDDQFLKMYKCRYCAYLDSHKVNVEEHEIMHSEHEDAAVIEIATSELSYSCPDCSYVCNSANLLTEHFKVHQNSNGQIHRLVDLNKSDDEQITELNNFLCKTYPSEETQVNMDGETDTLCETEQINAKVEIIDLEPEKILFFCQHCPARYFYEKELESHIRFHGSRLFYRCDYCTYTARQRPHLLTHFNVHTQEYNEETKILQNDLIVSRQYSPPDISIVADAQISNEPVWTVTSELNATLNKNNENGQTNQHNKLTNKKFACTKCPTKFYNGELLAYHMTLHGGKHPYKCHTCDYSAITRNNLEKHERIHMKNKESSDIQISLDNIPINPGSRIYQQILDAKKHNEKLVIQNEDLLSLTCEVQISNSPDKSKYRNKVEKRYKCLKCPCTFEKREQFKLHLSLHGSKQRYQCDKCDFSVKHFANYAQHIKRHESDKNVIYADDPENDIKEIIIDDIDEISDDYKSPKLAGKTIQSSQPGALKLSLADRQTLMILQEIRNNNLPKDHNTEEKKLFWCPHCPYTSYRRDAVDNHVNRHICVSGIKSNYKCDHCDYTVPQSHFLREHTKVHFNSFKFHQPEGYMVCKKMKLSFEKCNDNKTDLSSNVDKDSVLFEDSGNDVENSDGQYKPQISQDILREVSTDIKIYVNPDTQEIVENGNTQEINEMCILEKKITETKEIGKS